MTENLDFNRLVNLTDEQQWKKAYNEEVIKLDKLYQEQERLTHQSYLSGKQSPLLKEIDKQKYEVMVNEELTSSLSSWKQSIPDPTWKRRIEVLLNSMEQEVAESNLTVLEKKNKLMKSIMENTFTIEGTEYNVSSIQATLMENPDRELRRKVLIASNSSSEETEETFRELIRERNNIAENKGFSNYYKYRLSLLGIDFEAFIKQLYDLRKATNEANEYWLNRIKEKFGWEEVHFYDRIYAALNLTEVDPELFPTDRIKGSLLDMISTLGLNIEKLPIDIRTHGIPFGGYCASVSPQEIYVVINEMNHITSFLTGTHETGHAIDYHFSSYEYPELYRFKSIIAAECISELFQTVATDKEFLKKNFDVTDEDIFRVKELEKLTNLTVLQLNSYMTILEYEIYANPELDFQIISNQLIQEIFGVEGDGYNPINQMIFVSNPTYMQDYIFALAFREMIRHSFNISSVYGEKEVFEKLKKVFIVPGERFTWKEKAEKLCGEEFSFKYLAKSFYNGAD